MADDDIIRDIAKRVEALRISHQIKEIEIEENTGISRKTLYNFKQAATGFSLKNLIRLLKALDEVDRLPLLFPETENYSPSADRTPVLPKGVRDKQRNLGEFS